MDSIVVHADETDSRVRFIIDDVVISGNKITRDQIILRELTFQAGDTIASYQLGPKLRMSRENLLNTSLFNFVFMEDSIVVYGIFSHLVIKIDLIERWYIWPFPIFEISDRNFNSWWEDKDLNRVSYGVYLVKENCRGRMESLKLLLRFGFDERYVLSYDIPYFNKKQTFGAGFGVGWSQNHEIAFQTIDNKLQFVRDKQKYLFKHYFTYLNITHRPNFYHHHLLELSHNFYAFDDTVLNLNHNYSFMNENTNEYLTLSYGFTSDHRDSKVYPLNGNYFDFKISKSGFGFLNNCKVNMLEMMSSFRKYWELINKVNFSTDLAGKYSANSNQPYFYQKGLGYNRNFVRGYELYVIDGQSYWLAKNTFKYTVIPTKVGKFGFIKSEKFNKIHYALYINWFLDAGFVYNNQNDEGNNLTNELLLGTGLGIDFVTYYDVVFRVEFSLNRQGETGIFVHFNSTL